MGPARRSLIALVIACGVVAAGAAEGVGEKAPEKKPKVKLAEAVEKALAELANEAVKVKREARMEDMTRVVAEITEVSKLSDEQKKAVEAGVKTAVERSLAPWREEFDTRLRPYLSNEGDGALSMLSQWPADQLVRSGFPGDFGKPEDDPEWKAFLKKTLTAEQFAALDKVAGERERKLDEQIATYLKPFVEQARNARAAALTTEVQDLKVLLGLPDDRVKLLEEKVKSSAERAGEVMSQKATKTLRAMQEQQRASFLASGRSVFNAGGDGEDDLEIEESSEGIWKKGLANVLTPEERGRWEAAGQERLDRGARALAMMFLAEMDRRVQFSNAQRQKLEPVAIKALAEKAKNPSRNEGVSLTQASLFKAEEVKPILDEGQWSRWEAAGRGEGYGQNGNRRPRANGAKQEPKDDEAAKGKAESTDDEKLFAAHFEKRLADKRREMAVAMEAKADDVRRVVSLAPDRARYLEVAAKGAVEHALDTWRAQFDSWVRNSVQGAKGEVLRKRLEGLDNDNVWFGDEGQPGDHAVWKDAIAEALTPEQKKAWDAEVAARDAYRQRAFSWGILAELNRRYHLSDQQFAKLEPLVQAAVTEYFEDFTNMFGRGSSMVMPRYLVTLFAAVPEDQAKAILNEPQWKQWKDNDSKQLSGWWESMKNNHRWKNQKK